MRRWIIVIIAVLAGVAGFRYWSKLQDGHLQLQNIAQSLSQNEVVQDIQKQILTSGPLRGTQNAPDAFLAAAGVIQQTNVERGSNGLPALKENVLLNQAAALKLKDMFERQYFDHISPLGKGPGDLAEQAGYQYITVGENLALGNYKDNQTLVEAWMNSPGHRANILNSRFQEIGVAVGKGVFEGRTVWLAVQEFGKPSSACPAINLTLRDQISGYKSEAESLGAEINRLKTVLEAGDPKTKKEVESYNQRVSEYNSLVKIYNNKLDVLRQLIDTYNSQIKVYNQCAGG